MSYEALVIQRALYAAAALGIADAFPDSAETSDHVAARIGAPQETTYRLLRALASAGVLEEEARARFRLTELGELLRSDHPQSMRAWVRFSGDPRYVAAWSDVVYTIQTGRPAWDRVNGSPFFDSLAASPEFAAIFDAAMTSISHEEALAVADAYDFSGFRTIVDVGGGQGLLLTEILQRNQEVQGILFDQPNVAADAQHRLIALGLQDRCEVASGDFFLKVPSNGDAYLMKYILHDWTDDRAIDILRSTRRAIKPSGKLLVMETVVPNPGEAHFAKLQDLEMLVLFASRERTESEYTHLFAEARFGLARTVPTAVPISILEAIPI